MQTLIFSSEQYKKVADITRPYIKGEYIYKGLPSNDDPNHWGTPVFNDISRITAKYCLDLMNEMKDGEVLFYCDSDVLLLEHPQWFADQIGDNDFVFQSDKGTACMGFYIVKVSDKTKKVIESSISAMIDNKRNFQEVFNDLYKEFDITYDFFKESDVWNYGVIGEMWDGQDFKIPKDLKAFHANYTVGVENKVKLLIKAINNMTVNVLIPSTKERRPRLELCLNALKESTVPIMVTTFENQLGGWVRALIPMIENLADETVIFIINDDMIVEPDCIEKQLKHYKQGYVLQCNDGIQNGKIATTPFTDVGTFKKYLCKDYWHSYADQEIYDRASKDERFIYVEDAKLTHQHFTKGAEMDETYKRTQSKLNEDRETYIKRYGKI